MLPTYFKDSFFHTVRCISTKLSVNIVRYNRKILWVFRPQVTPIVSCQPFFSGSHTVGQLNYIHILHACASSIGQVVEVVRVTGVAKFDFQFDSISLDISAPNFATLLDAIKNIVGVPIPKNHNCLCFQPILKFMF